MSKVKVHTLSEIRSEMDALTCKLRCVVFLTQYPDIVAEAFDDEVVEELRRGMSFILGELVTISRQVTTQIDELNTQKKDWEK